ncbi:MAG: hypothetical protein NTX04_05075 [Verrucomicrobia bacterium]|nr:hypothetical protein [Verrucomicrobiota bacterium]
MKTSSMLVILAWGGFVAISGGRAAEGNGSLAESEVVKCEEKIATVRRDVLGKYDDALAELQMSFQKAADLEGALAVRAERQRFGKDRSLSERELVGEPKSLRQTQLQYLSKMQELVGLVVQETLPRLVELKRSLTTAGKLDEAVLARAAMEKLQNGHIPVARSEAGAVVGVDTVLLAYAGDRGRADKTYKGQKLIVRGVVSGFRPEGTDGRFYQVYLSGPSGGGVVQCTLASSVYRIREDRSNPSVPVLVVTLADGDGGVWRIQKGQAMDIRGVCEGLDEVVRLGRGELMR